MFYTLYNESNKAYLNHPRVGMWHSDDRGEAEDMLKACRDYLHAAGVGFMAEQVSVVGFEDEVELKSRGTVV